MDSPFSILLIAHLVGAAVSGALVIASIAAWIRASSYQYRPLAVGLAWGAGFQLVSGSALTLLSLKEASLLAFCGRIGFYVAAIGLAELMLYARMRAPYGSGYPVSRITVPFTGGAASVTFTLFALLGRS